MRPKSKAAKAEGYDALKRKLDVYEEFAWHIANGIVPDHCEIAWAGDNDTPETLHSAHYEFAVYGTMRAHGGIVAIKYVSDVNKSASIDLHYCSDYEKIDQAKGYERQLPLRIAWERCRVAMSRIWQGERERIAP